MPVPHPVLITYRYTLTTFRDWLSGFARALAIGMEGDVLRVPEYIGSGHLRIVDLPGGPEALAMDYTLHQDVLMERDMKVRSKEFYVFCCDNVENIGRMFVANADDRAGRAATNFRAMQLMSSLSDPSPFTTAGTHVSGVRILLSTERVGQYLHVDEKADVLRRYLDLKAQNMHIKEHDVEHSALLADIVDASAGGGEIKDFTYIQDRIMLLADRFFFRMGQNAGVPKQKVRMTRDEIDTILAVEAQLVKDLSCAPTIPQLAKASALSPSKLKKQFKDVFGMPIYAHFQQARMARARELLLDGRRSVKEVGMNIGYTNLSNFSLAFRKVFGVLPSVIGKASRS